MPNRRKRKPSKIEKSAVKIVAVTGSFGSGKTTVGKMFELLGCPFISADKIVSVLYKKKQVKKLLEKKFGEQIFSKKGRLNKKALAGLVFSDKKLLQKLNSLMHPLVFLEMEKKLRALLRQGKKVSVVEVPLLFESRQFFPKDFVVVVKCTKKTQIKRLGKKGFSKKEALERIKAQMPAGKKIAMADFVVDNSGTVLATRKHVKKIFGQIVA